MMRALLLSFGLLFPLLGGAQAPVYRVDLIVYLDRQGSGGSRADLARPPPALDLTDAAALSRAGITVLPDEAFGLTTEWSRLRNAQRYQPLLRLAWTQVNAPEEGGPRIALAAGTAVEGVDADRFVTRSVTPLHGSVALNLGRFLHLDVDLRYHEGSGRQHQLLERRRMRRDELHYLDNPRIGVLARVVRADGGS